MNTKRNKIIDDSSINTGPNFNIYRSLLAMFSIAILVALTNSASAELRFCNGTGSRVGVAIGHKDGTDWVSEGWWNIEPGDCRAVLQEPLASRFYYVHAIDYDHGGEWGGETIMCTQDNSFTIRGIGRCEQRGYTTSGFYEVDTGERASFTVQLLEDSIQQKEQ